ncbi:MAG: leucine-rich repeat domain-containing protein [Treponema sp.]|nr:leucine-rich repeat domain-containing protein [Treponema sp.]
MKKAIGVVTVLCTLLSALGAQTRASSYPQTILDQGIIAESSGDRVEALTCYYRALSLDPALSEAELRAEALTDSISKGTFGSDTRSSSLTDIQLQSEWLKLLREAAAYFREHQPFEIIYDPALTKGASGSTSQDASFTLGIWPDYAAYRTMETIVQGLQNTGRSATWAFGSWPLSGGNLPADAVIFPTNSTAFIINAVLLNDQGKTIGTAYIRIAANNGSVTSGQLTIPQPNAINASFQSLNPEDITANLSVDLASVNSISTRTALERGYISISLEKISGLFSGSSDLQYRWENNGTVSVTGRRDYGGSITIPAKIGRWPVTTIGERAFANNQLNGVTIPDSITSIGKEAFYVNQLHEISIPGNVTNIGAWSFFSNCLTSLTIPDSVNIIGEGAFSDNQLSQVSIGKNVRSLGEYTFYDNQLTQVKIPDSVVSIGYRAFYSNEIADLDLGKSLVTIGDSTFAYNRLSSLTIPDSVTYIGVAAFSGNDLTSLTIGNGVTTIGESAFYNNELTSLNIGESVTSIGESAFYDNKLSNVTIPNSVISIGYRAFYRNELKSISIGRNVSSIGESAFAYNDLISVIIPANVSLYYLSISNGFDAFYNDLGKKAGIYRYRDGVWTLEESSWTLESGEMVAEALPEDAPLEGWPLGEVIESVRPEEALPKPSAVPAPAAEPAYVAPPTKSLFLFWNGEITAYTGDEKDIQIPAIINGQPVTTIGEGAFASKGLSSVIIPDSITTIGPEAFSGNQLHSIVIPGNVSKLGKNAFASNPITSITLSGIWDFSADPGFFPNKFCQYFDNNGRRGGTYRYADGAWSWSAPVLSFPRGQSSVGYRAFYNFQLSGALNLPEGLSFIGELAFAANHLTSLVIPDSVVSIGKAAFNGNQLISVTIGKGVSSISELAFRNIDDRNNRLTTITIPANVILLTGQYGVFPFNFDSFYNSNGKKAGTYVYQDGKWSLW